MNRLRDILAQNFETVYKRDSWFKKDSPTGKLTNRFSITDLSVDNLIRVSRKGVSTLQTNEKYMIIDRMEYQKGNEITYYEIRTSEYDTIEHARDGFFYKLWGAERLKSREEGAINVGELSFGFSGYVCFIRNNVCISVSEIGTRNTGVMFETIVQEIDRQIISSSKISASTK